jgi:hypothetical protein
LPAGSWVQDGVLYGCCRPAGFENGLGLVWRHRPSPLPHREDPGRKGRRGAWTGRAREPGSVAMWAGAWPAGQAISRTRGKSYFHNTDIPPPDTPGFTGNQNTACCPRQTRIAPSQRHPSTVGRSPSDRGPATGGYAEREGGGGGRSGKGVGGGGEGGARGGEGGRGRSPWARRNKRNSLASRHPHPHTILHCALPRPASTPDPSRPQELHPNGSGSVVARGKDTFQLRFVVVHRWQNHRYLQNSCLLFLVLAPEREDESEPQVS